MNDKPMMRIVGAVERTVDGTKKTWWTSLGLAFRNRDGSLTLKFDYVPARMGETTIQLRELDSKDTTQPASE
jgi:hypothetical protein